jgi:hypothetical protein
MGPASYLVFGDLHGKVLPAFRLALAWSREHGVALAGLLQVGDLADFPFSERRAPRDALEAGVRLVARPSRRRTRCSRRVRAPRRCGSRPATTRTSTCSSSATQEKLPLTT